MENKIIKTIAASRIMRQQAGGRMIVSFTIKRDGYTTRNTSHYADMVEVMREWNRLIARHGDVVEASSGDPRFIIPAV